MTGAGVRAEVTMPERLHGRHAVVTGSARGIGRAIASRLVSEGATVLAVDVDLDAGVETASTLGCRFHALDVTSEAGWAALKNEPVDILVNNAGGLLTPTVLHEHDLDSWRATLELNLTSVFLGMRWALPQMIGRKAGVIVNVCSVSGIVGQPDAPAYQAAKAGVALLTRNAALTYASSGIRVNAVSPSVVATPALDHEPPERLQAFLARVPLGWAAEPADIAAAVAYLASDDARYVTGTNLVVDGGYCA
jgi:NAD(P)-dependent dehydrogenase (short-subunit alcohol dehydrogenase family)